MVRLLPRVCVCLVVIAATAMTAVGGEIEEGLEAILQSTRPGEPISVLVFLNEQVELDALAARFDRENATLRDRHAAVVRALQAAAEQTQGEFLAAMAEQQNRGSVLNVNPYWISNCIRVEATAAAVREIAARPDVLRVYYNYEIELDAPVGDAGGGRDGGGDRTPTAGVQAVRAPEVWAMGFNGQGILVATLDTGVDGTHPALASRWRGVADPRYQGHPQWAWFDPVTNTTFPQSFGSHGTHTMGSVCGGPPGQDIGVAPGVQWIHAAVIDRVSISQTVADAILAFQWLLDPDGDPETNWDVPAVCSNSWRVTTGHGYPPCDQTFWTYLDACHAAGIVILFSAGNEGPGSQTIGRPPDRATDEYRTCAIGAVDANSSSWPIADFSSRGPSYCAPGGQMAIKPELVAPGVGVYSSVPGGGYQSSGWNGTSMASPHVNGVVALVRQACPDLTVEQVLQILYDTAYDLGPGGNDNAYGWGMVDAYEAVTLALAMCASPPTAYDGSEGTPTNTPVAMTLEARDLDNGPEPMTFIITSLPADGSLNDPGAGAITAAPYALVGHGDVVLYTPNPWYVGSDAFQFKANDGGVPPDGGDSNVATVSIEVGAPVTQQIYFYPLDTNPGWTTEGQWAFGQPAGGGSHNRDPLSGYTGTKVFGYNLLGDYPNNMSGVQCLTTAPINCAYLNETRLRFRRWLAIESAQFDHARVQVSTDGATWTSVWENPMEPISETAWSLQTIDIAAVADGHATVYIRWTLGPTDYSVTYPGWNIDDVEVWAVAQPCATPRGNGDVNLDGTVDARDIQAFVRVLLQPGTAMSQELCAADVQTDGAVDMADLEAFVAVLLGL